MQKVQLAPSATLPETDRSRRDERAIAVFGTWMVVGLFLDGWAHMAEKPETFFSPWHGVLYSGFVAAMIWFAVDGWRANRSVLPVARSQNERLTMLGVALFVTGAVGDGVWHEIFGIEVDLEALLSPTHLLLLVGGFLMLGHPLRAAFRDPDEQAPSFRDFLPQIVALTLTTAVASFFTMYLSAFGDVAHNHSLSGDLRETAEVAGIAAIFVTNLLLLGPLLYVLRRWSPPPGTFTIVFTSVGLLMTGLEGFDMVELAIPAFIAGVLADVLVSRGTSPRVVAAVVPLALWLPYFAVADLSYGVSWAAELWTGAVLLASMSGLVLGTLVQQAPEPA
jgi:hypothetical protein